jgi:hypothetical protein
MHHGDVPHQEIGAELERRWPGHKRADIQPFWSGEDKSTNLRRTINYAMKNECRSHLGMVEERWPASWMAEYYSDLHEWSRGFQSTRFNVYASKKAEAEFTEDALVDDDLVYSDVKIDPMPFMSTNSTFDIYYYWRPPCTTSFNSS